MTLLTTKIDENTDAVRRNAAHNRGLAEALRAKVAESALGGTENNLRSIKLNMANLRVRHFLLPKPKECPRLPCFFYIIV